MQGDASTRIFERLTQNDRTFILMNAPRRPDGPAVRDGKPYSAIAHLAEDIVPYVALAAGLRDLGLSAPEILHADLDSGLIVMEDFGDEHLVSGDPPAPVETRYTAAVDLLAVLHAQELPDMLPVTPQFDYWLPPYDMEAFLIEAELLLDWYLVSAGAEAAGTRPQRLSSGTGGRLCCRPLPRRRHGCCAIIIRLICCGSAERDDIARIGLLDFQDALVGPAAYDVASLLQDARVDVPEAMEMALLGRYVRTPAEQRSGIRHRRLHPHLCDAGGATGDQNPRHFCPARPPRWQAAISASHAAPVGLPAALAKAPGAVFAQGLVRHKCARSGWVMMVRFV